MSLVPFAYMEQQPVAGMAAASPPSRDLSAVCKGDEIKSKKALELLALVQESLETISYQAAPIEKKLHSYKNLFQDIGNNVPRTIEHLKIVSKMHDIWHEKHQDLLQQSGTNSKHVAEAHTVFQEMEELFFEKYQRLLDKPRNVLKQEIYLRSALETALHCRSIKWLKQFVREYPQESSSIFFTSSEGGHYLLKNAFLQNGAAKKLVQQLYMGTSPPIVTCPVDVFLLLEPLQRQKIVKFYPKTLLNYLISQKAPPTDLGISIHILSLFFKQQNDRPLLDTNERLSDEEESALKFTHWLERQEEGKRCLKKWSKDIFMDALYSRSTA